MSKYRGFYKKTVDERIDILNLERAYLTDLEINDASHMIENAIGVFEVPLGVAPEFLIDQKMYQVPMATEESSVIAAASHGAKIIAKNGGFKTDIPRRLMRGEIIFAEPKDSNKLINQLEASYDHLKTLSDEAHPSIVQRGGGVTHFETRRLETFVILDVFMDTQEAMGANMMNTVLESLSNYLKTKTQETILMAILSNLTTESIVSARCEIKVSDLKHGLDTAKKIVLASKLAEEDIYRCATHNKGIMNGIEAVVLASGNDTRAVNAGIYTYSNMSGKPKPLATWSLEEDTLIGDITIPLALGSVGGAISIHPKAMLSKSIMNYTNVKELMSIVASVGLAQNFAALYALTTVGIQKGHMALHAKNIAKSAGAQDDILEAVSLRLQKEKTINIETAKKIIQEILNEKA